MKGRIRPVLHLNSKEAMDLDDTMENPGKTGVPIPIREGADSRDVWVLSSKPSPILSILQCNRN